MAQDPSETELPREWHWPEITDHRVRAAFAAVPRAEFVPPGLRSWADRDAPLPIGEGQTISQPFVVALMTQALALQPGDRVLEIGTGSGYQTAILCELTAAEGMPAGASVYSVERFPSLACAAHDTLARLGYAPHVTVGDGAAGWPDQAPFAAILAAAAPSHLPRPLWEQLAEAGRMVLPIGVESNDQILWLLRKVDGELRGTWMGPVRFVPLVSSILTDPAMWIEIPEERRQGRQWTSWW